MLSPYGSTTPPIVPKKEQNYCHLACHNHLYLSRWPLFTKKYRLGPWCTWYCHRVSTNCTGLPFWSLWFCVQKLVQVAVNCLYHTLDPPGMFINGVWTQHILHWVSLLVNGTLYAHFGSRNIYFQFLSDLFWGDFGTYFWCLMSCQQKTTHWENVLASNNQL